MRALRAVLVLIGFTAVTAQVVLMRELLVLFSGTEISLGLMLGSWLVWTALGSGLLGRLWSKSLTPVLEILAALALPLTILATRAARGALQTAPGEILSPGVMLVVSLAVLGPFCALNGWLFAAGSRLYAGPTARATATAYLLEAAGSAAGGILVSVLLIRYLDAFQISLLLALVNLIAAACLGGIMMGLPLVAVVLLASLVRLDAVSLAWPWRGFDLVDVRNSVYGNLVLVGREGAATLYENGLAVVTVPDPEAAEEAVHYALLEHPAPSSLLLIGGGTNGSLAEALKHPGLRRVDYVELDPAILELADRHFSAAWSRARNDPRVHVHYTDGRLLLQTTAESFDVIIVSLPDPQTAQLNRFYTVEFFRQAARRLRPGGVFSFQLTSAENYISPELAALLRCIYKTLGAVFPHVAFLPGNTVHFFASNRPGQLVTSAGGLLERLRARGIQTTYVREYYIPFRMMPDRMTSLAAEIRPRADTPVNRDFAPIAYYFDAVLWSKRFGRSRWMEPFGYAAILGAIALALILTVRRRPKEASAFAAGAMGFSMIGLEILLLLGFQALHGYVYHQLAMLIAMFMTGMAAGSWLGLRSSGHDLGRLAAVQCATAAAPVLLCLLLERHAAAFLFPVLALACGLLGGYQFPVASRVFFAGKGSPGSLYALDLAGSSLGAVLFSAWLIPLFGFWSAALVMAAMSLASVLPVLRAQGR